MVAPTRAMHEMYERTPDGKIRMHLHQGQIRAWNSEARFVAVVAGSQGGKTILGPPWLYREIQRRGPGDYLVVSPTYKLLGLKALPEFLRYFKGMLQLGDYVSSPIQKFTFSNDGARRTFGYVPTQPTTIHFGHAQNPDSLESMTAKGAWCDEAGQKAFRLGSWEAIQRRLSIHEGRAFLTTTPYDLGWLKKEIYDRWVKGDKDYAVINFASNHNPSFPIAEYERAKRTLPKWKFDLFYRGIFTKPAGLIYDCFDENLHTCVPFGIPNHWPRYRGLDFGGINTVAVYFAEDPLSGMWYGYREYHAGNRTAREHVECMGLGEPGTPYRSVGGSKSEQSWRDEYAAAGLPVEEPDQPSVEVGITRVYGGIKMQRVKFFTTMKRTIDQINSYSRELDDSGEPTLEIEDKASFHELDGCRYILSWKFRENSGGWGDVQLPSAEESEYYGRTREY